MKKVLAVFLSILTVMSFVSITASAETLVYDNFLYSTDTDTNTGSEYVVISGYSSSDVETINIPDTINGLDVKRIGSYAFQNFTKLKTIVFNDNLTNIEKSAFAGCSSLTEVELPDNITYIDNYAFKSCTSLSTVNYPHI